MAQHSYAVYLRNDGTGNYQVVALADPSTLPVSTVRVAMTPIPYFPNTTAYNITAATNAAPIAITTSAAHGRVTGDAVYIRDADGNTAANGTFIVTVTGATTLTLDGSSGNGSYTNAGTAADPYATLQFVPTMNNPADVLNTAVDAILNRISNTA